MDERGITCVKALNCASVMNGGSWTHFCQAAHPKVDSRSLEVEPSGASPHIALTLRLVRASFKWSGNARNGNSELGGVAQAMEVKVEVEVEVEV
jgi:hypothetical protein